MGMSECDEYRLSASGECYRDVPHVGIGSEEGELTAKLQFVSKELLKYEVSA